MMLGPRGVRPSMILHALYWSRRKLTTVCRLKEAQRTKFLTFWNTFALGSHFTQCTSFACHCLDTLFLFS